MNNKRLLSVIGQIDDKFIFAAAPDMKKTITYHWLRWSAVAACLCLVLVGFGMWKGGLFESSVPPIIDLPEYNATGGEGIFDYERAYAPNFYLNASEKELKKYDIPVSTIKEKAEMLLTDGVITESVE